MYGARARLPARFDPPALAWPREVLPALIRVSSPSAGPQVVLHIALVFFVAVRRLRLHESCRRGGDITL